MSLVRTLLSGTMESVDLGGYDYTSEASMESYYLDAACESLVTDIYNVDKAFHVADVIGEVKVLQEGADPEVLLEGILGDAIGKLKDAFKKFLAKIKAWVAKIKKYFQVMFMKGKDLVKKYGNEIRKKSTKGFKYKGYNYKIDAGDDFVEKASEKVTQKINSTVGNMEDLINSADMGESLQVYIKANIGSEQVKELTKTATDAQDSLVKFIDKSCEDVGELTAKISDVYHDGDDEKSEIEDFEANDPSEMLDFLEKFDKAIKDMDKEQKKFEKDVNSIIKSLDKISGEKVEINGKTSTPYQIASKMSTILSGYLAVRKSVIDKKTSIYKEINGSFTSVLKSFVLKKEVKESAFYRDFDSLIALTEADVEPEPMDPEDIGDDEEVTKEGGNGKACGKGCKESYGLLEAAYDFM